MYSGVASSTVGDHVRSPRDVRFEVTFDGSTTFYSCNSRALRLSMSVSLLKTSQSSIVLHHKTMSVACGTHFYPGRVAFGCAFFTVPGVQ